MPTPTPASLTLDVGVPGQVSANLFSRCAADPTDVAWTSTNSEIATIDATGRVMAVGVGEATLVATAFGEQVRTSVSLTVRPRIATTLAATPRRDTLERLATRALSVSVRDQRGDPLPGAFVAWVSLAPTVASVSEGGVVTAVDAGIAQVVASTARTNAGALRDTVLIVVLAPPIETVEPPVTPPPVTPPPVIPPTTPPTTPPTSPPTTPPTTPQPTPPPTSPPAPPPASPPTPPPASPPAPPPAPPPASPPTLPPTPPPTPPPAPAPPPVVDCRTTPAVTLGSTLTGSFSGATCRNLYGFPLATQYLLTASHQSYYAIQFTSTGPAALVPLNNGASLLPPVTTMSSPYFVVTRPGTFGFLMTAGAGSTASYSVRTTRDPDPRASCAPTYATVGVTFSTALTATCASRTILIVTALAPLQPLRVTVTTPTRPVKLELVNAATGAVLREEKATPGRPTATLTFINGEQAIRVVLRVSGSNVDGLIPIEIAP